MEIQTCNFDLPIWRVMPDHARHAVAVEIRDRTQKVSYFFYIDLHTGTKQEIVAPNPWWIGLQEVHDGRVLLHGYENPGLPIHRGIYCFEGITGRMSWQEPLMKFEAMNEHHLLLNKDSGSWAYDWSSGKQLKEVIDRKAYTTFEEKRRKNLYFPLAYIDRHPDFSSIAYRVSTSFHHHPVRQIDYLPREQYEVLNYYETNEHGSLTQRLGILHQGKSIHEEIVGKNLSKLALDPYFQFKRHLIWIHRQQVLTYCLLE